jgi:ribonuclease H / adenosylcobalamin/alpha-ribazole phosphatase
MKWPNSLTLVRHDSSAYNVLKPLKQSSPLYQQFIKAFQFDPSSDNTRLLANKVKQKFALPYADHNTPLAAGSGVQAKAMSQKLCRLIPLPDVIFVSPYERTISTLEWMIQGWPKLKTIKTIFEERITEQDHGLSSLYSDWKVFLTLHPEQLDLFNRQGEYRYRFPQGENIPDVRERVRSWFNTLTRDFSGKNVLAVTHHLAILSIRANLERFDEAEFLRLDQEEKPINAGVTIYLGQPDAGTDGHLVLDKYNTRLY